MAFVLRLTFFILLFCVPLLSYDFTDIKSSFVSIERSGYISSDEPIAAADVATLLLDKELKPLPAKGISFGFDRSIYYFAFLIRDEGGSRELFLELKNPSFNRVNLSVFREGKLVRYERNGYLIPKDKREIQDFPIRFLLEEGEALYIVEASSKSPKFTAFALGEKAELDKSWYASYVLFFSVSGIFLFLFLFSILFFAMLKESLYLYYALNNLGLFGAILITQGYAWFIGNEAIKLGAFAAFFIQLQLVGLVFFSEKFLEIKTISKKLSKTLQITLYANLAVSALLFFDNNLKFLSFVFMVALFLLLIFCAILALKKNFTPAFYYLIATGVALFLLIGFTLAHQGVIIYDFFTFNLLSFALLWEMVFFSIAIAQKVRLLQQESIEKERILSFRSRREALGELSGNIAHQWRTPLAEIGAIISNYKAKLLYQNPSSKDGVEVINRVESILKHLSSTVETFQSFFQNNEQEGVFCLNKEIERSISFIRHSLKNNDIELRLICKEEGLSVAGNANEFAQALLAIVLNAKDILIERNIKNRTISVSLYRKDDFAIVDIEDNGGGVKIVPIQKIFESFVTDRASGVGVGLFIAKTVVEKKLKGVMSVKNYKKGACFSIKLPLMS